MRFALLSAVALAALAGSCASREQARDLQASQAPYGPSGSLVFGERSEFRGAVAVEYIGGVSQYSYVFAEPNGAAIRHALQTALDNSGLGARTSTRARYAVRVNILEADGPAVGGDFHSRLRAEYTLVDRATGQTAFSKTVATDAETQFIGFHEGDLRNATQRSARAMRAVTALGLVHVSADLLDNASLDLDGGDDAVDYDAWTHEDWNDFWQVYKEAMIAAAVVGPVTATAEVVNPWNFLPWADDDAGRANGRHGSRIGSDRAAQANNAAIYANVTQFLIAFADSQGVKPRPVLPCHGSPQVESFKRALLARGETFTTDNCMVSR